MLFNYEGMDSSGTRVKGNVDAGSRDAALQELKRKNITPIRLNSGGKISSGKGLNIKVDFSGLLQKKISHDDLLLFCRQMFALTRSGIPLIRAINGLAEANRHDGFAKILRKVAQSLQTGTDLASSLSQHPKVFPPLFVSMVHMGETTGRLDQAFQQLIGHLQLEKETSKQIKSATRYPTLVVLSIAAAMGVINWLVIPKFATVFQKFGSELPTPTKILITTSNFSVQYWWLILSILVLLGVGFIQYTSTNKGRIQWDKIKLRIPVIGSILERITLGRFTRPFAMMLDAGVPLLQALTVCSRTVGNAWVAKQILAMQQNIERGDSLLNTAASSNLFNALILQMIAVGEETGQVSAMLNDVSDFYEQEVDYELKRMSEVIEPILLVFMGVMVLILALGVFLPMWDLGSAAI